MPPAAVAPPPGGVPPTATGGVPPSPEDANAALGRLTTFIHSPESVDLSDLTLQVRRQQMSQRLAQLQSRTEELLAKGEKLESAVAHAKSYITQAIRKGFAVGAGHSPVHHFYRFWKT